MEEKGKADILIENFPSFPSESQLWVVNFVRFILKGILTFFKLLSKMYYSTHFFLCTHKIFLSLSFFFFSCWNT